MLTNTHIHSPTNRTNRSTSYSRGNSNKAHGEDIIWQSQWHTQIHVRLTHLHSNTPHFQLESPRPHHPMSDPTNYIGYQFERVCNTNSVLLMHSVHNNRCPPYISDVVQSTKTASTRGGLRSAESTAAYQVRRALRARLLLSGTSCVEPPTRVNPQNIVTGSL